MTWRRLAACAFCGVLMLVGATRPAEGEDTDPFLVADFETGAESEQYGANRSKAERVPAGDGQALRWIQQPAKDGGWLSFFRLPPDLRPYRRLIFRVRSIGAMHEELTIRFREEETWLGTNLGRITETWQTVEILLPLMDAKEGFTGEALQSLMFACWETEGFQVELDDIRLVKARGGWRFTLEDLQALGRDPAGRVYHVADAEGAGTRCEVRAANSSWERIPLKGRDKGHCIRWTVAATKDTVWLTLLAVPQDIRAYRRLRFRARIPDRRLDDQVVVRIRSDGGSIGKRLPSLKRRWTDVELELSAMETQETIDPEKVEALRLVAWGPKGFTLDIDDLQLVKGPGGWRMSEEEHVAHLFGEKRVKKVKRIDTEHFEIFTDSAGARRKLPKALEKTYDFVIASLALGEMEEKLPIYIFQNPRLYHEFCIRKGWTREEAEATAGHAWTDYFAAYYQAADAPTVTHELTHSIFHRVRGTGGGSWFQEGVAVYVEELSQKRSVAKVFAPRLRSGQFMGLREFITSPRLISEKDIRGGAGTSESLYLQAGAFFEYLLRGPPSEAHPKAIAELALLDEYEAGEVLGGVERILGASVDEIEKAWVAWGGHPPAHPNR